MMLLPRNNYKNQKTTAYRTPSPPHARWFDVVLNRANAFVGVLSTLLIVGVFVAAATPALAGIGGSVVPSFPTPINVGDIKTATITITNRATTPNNSENIGVSGIFF